MPPVYISDLTPLSHVPPSLTPFVEPEVISPGSGHPFIKLTIRGPRENSLQPHTICALIDLIAKNSSLTNAVRHLDIQYAEDDEHKQAMDPYVEHAGLSKLFRLCTNLQTASIEGFCPSRYRNNYISTLHHSFHSSDHLTELEIFRFRGTNISELCLFLSNFPNLKDIKGLNCDLKDLEALSKSLSLNRGATPASVDFDNPALAHFVPKGIVALRQIRSVVFNGKPLGRLAGSDSAFMDLLGSSYTLFPKLELLNYRNDDLLVRMQRSLDRLRGSLRTLQLGTGPRGMSIPFDSTTYTILICHTT